MLKKMLHYDMKAVFKYWWIGAIVAFAAALVTAPAVEPLTSEKVTDATAIVSSLVIVFAIFCLTAFLIVSEILIFAHFYKNLFTDQGYLTFTLPVKRTTLLNSKLITGVATMLATGLVSFISVGFVIVSTFYDDILEWFKEEGIEFLTAVWENSGGILIVGIIEIIALIILCTIFSVLFLFTCITIGAVITRKMKLLASIGVYYAGNSVMGIFGTIFSLCGMPAMITWLSELSSDEEIFSTLALIGLLLVLAMSVLCVTLYTLQLWFTDKKLNLA